MNLKKQELKNTISILGVTSPCTHLIVIGIGLVVVPVTRGVSGGLGMFSRIVGGFMKR